MREGITFIMPAYNVEKYVEDAIRSIQAQTVSDWNLILIDDGSTDSTLEMVNSIASKDDRIKVLHSSRGSGSAYQPRKRGILESDTRWVAPLDADDWIEPAYLEKLIDRQKETGADIVYPIMYSPATDAHPDKIITPKESVVFENVFEGKDCVRFTLDGWRINCNGGLINRSVYEEAYKKYGSTLTYSCADELLTRQLLSLAPRVAFSKARYYYRENPESITRRKSVKLFDILINTNTLIPLIKDLYGIESEEYLLAQRQNFHAYFNALKLLNKYKFDKKEKREINALIKKAEEKIDIDYLKGKVGPGFYFLYKRGRLASSLGMMVRRYLYKD